MADDFVKYILTDATDAPFDSLLYAVSLLGKPYPLLIPIPPGKKDINNDLARLVDFPSGTKFQIRLFPNGGKIVTSPKVLTYSEFASKSAHFTVSGTVHEPILTFNKIE